MFIYSNSSIYLSQQCNDKTSLHLKSIAFLPLIFQSFFVRVAEYTYKQSSLEQAELRMSKHILSKKAFRIIQAIRG